MNLVIKVHNHPCLSHSEYRVRMPVDSGAKLKAKRAVVVRRGRSSTADSDLIHFREPEGETMLPPPIR